MLCVLASACVGAAALHRAFEEAEAAADHEGDIVAGIVVAEAGAGQVADVAFEKKRATIFEEEIRAERCAGREVDLRRVAWGNIGTREDNATFGGEVGCDFAAAREIPLPDEWADAAAVDAAVRRKDGVKRSWSSSSTPSSE